MTSSNSHTPRHTSELLNLVFYMSKAAMSHSSCLSRFRELRGPGWRSEQMVLSVFAYTSLSIEEVRLPECRATGVSQA
jgi:hypothetical protein